MGFITANTSLNSSLEKAGIIPDGEYEIKIIMFISNY